MIPSHSVSSPLGPNSVVLVVEDNEMFRSVVTIALRQYLGAGTEVLEAATVRAATGIVSSQPVDVLVIDMTLPDGSAITLLEKVGSFVKHGLKVVIMSNLTEDDRAPLLARADVAGYGEKSQGPMLFKHFSHITINSSSADITMPIGRYCCFLSGPARSMSTGPSPTVHWH